MDKISQKHLSGVQDKYKTNFSTGIKQLPVLSEHIL